MTKLRKLTALLLAGVLTLLLLTACSGGGGSSGPEAQAEAEVMRAIRSNSSTKNLEYDVGMCNIAKDELAKTNLDTKLDDLIGCITKNNEASNLNFNLSSKWTKVGVAAKTHNGKTYIAITLQVKRT